MLDLGLAKEEKSKPLCTLNPSPEYPFTEDTTSKDPAEGFISKSVIIVNPSAKVIESSSLTESTILSASTSSKKSSFYPDSTQN